MNKKHTNPRAMLLHIAEEDIPASKIELWSGVQKALLASKTTTQQGVSAMSKTTQPRRYPLALLAGFVFVLTMAFLLLSPQGNAFARQILGYFLPTDNRSHPVPEAALTAQANPEAVYPTEAPTSTPISASACPQTDAAASAEEKYRCDMAFLENELGEWVKVLPYNYGRLNYLGYKIDQIPTAAGAVLSIEYGPEPYGAITVMQGQGDFPKTISSDGSDDLWSEVPADAIQAVMVNGQPGEYVEGAFVQMMADGKPGDQYIWNAEVPMARLRWKENNTWFQVLRPGVPEQFRPVIGTKEGLVTLAEALVKAQALNR